MKPKIIISVENIKKEIMHSVLVGEEQKHDFSLYNNKGTFMLSWFLAIEFQYPYRLIKDKWDSEMEYTPKHYQGLCKDIRAIFWYRQGLTLAEIAEKLEYCDYNELRKKFKKRQRKDLSEFKIPEPATFKCLMQCENCLVCGEKHLFLGEKHS